jgi:hypothetical protein
MSKTYLENKLLKLCEFDDYTIKYNDWRRIFDKWKYLVNINNLSDSQKEIFLRNRNIEWLEELKEEL